MLNLLEGFDLASLELVEGLPSAEAIHLMVEAKKIAYADRSERKLTFFKNYPG